MRLEVLLGRNPKTSADANIFLFPPLGRQTTHQPSNRDSWYWRQHQVIDTDYPESSL